MAPTRLAYLAAALVGVTLVFTIADPPRSRPTHALTRATTARRAEALEGGWLAYQRHCRACHGVLGRGDGPYATTFHRRAPALVGSGPGALEAQLQRVRLGGAARPPNEEPWHSAMPSFGDVLTDPEIAALLVALRRRAAGPASPRGRATYEAVCAVCHGSNGAGDGPLAGELFPAPRDFGRAAYRIHSTASGAVPRDEDLTASVTDGLGDTAMGGFAPLGARALAATVRHVKGFAPERFGAAPPPAVVPPEAGGAHAAALARGAALYDDARCWQCHGAGGRGDGPTARELKDDRGHASLPANLTKRWQLKGGASAAALARAIATGFNGTAMPSYGEVLEPAELWELARYVATLGRDRPPPPRRIVVRRASGLLPRDPNAELWRTLATVAVPLGPQLFIEPRWDRPGVDLVEVAAATSADEIGFLVVWDDRFADTGTADVDAVETAYRDPTRVGRWRVPDRLALQFPRQVAADGSLPPLYLGAAALPVARWHWTAARADGPSEVEVVRGPRGTREPWVDAVPPVVRAQYEDGQWRVVLVAPRSGHHDVFGRGRGLAFAVQAWEGGSGESGARHGVSAWIELTLPEAGGAGQSAATTSAGSSTVSSSQPGA